MTAGGNPALPRFTDARVPDPGIAELFTLEQITQARLDVEAALALAEAEAGIVPAESARVIAEHADLAHIDLHRLAERTAAASHPLVALIAELAEAAGDGHGGWVHWGATTQNITQTADLVLLRRAHGTITALLARVIEGIAELADSGAELPMAGRTHSQHAVPITFGFKAAIWLDGLLAHAERLRHVEDRVFRVLAGGAVGTFASLGPAGRKVEAAMAARLGLGTMPVPSRATNDGMVEYVVALAQLGGTAGKIAKDVYSMMQPEFGEVAEPIPAGTVGSSTMPHKRNPQLTADVLTISAQLRALAVPALESMLHEHEVNSAMSALLEQTLRQAVVLAGDLLVRLAAIAEGLELDPGRMAANLDLSQGLISSEAIMMALAARLGRQRAHDIVFAAAQHAAVSGRPLSEVLRADEELAARLSPAELKDLLDPQEHLGESAVIARQVAAHAREVARGLRGPRPGADP